MLTDDDHVNQLRSLIRANRQLIIRELAEKCGILKVDNKPGYFKSFSMTDD